MLGKQFTGARTRPRLRTHLQLTVFWPVGWPWSWPCPWLKEPVRIIIKTSLFFPMSHAHPTLSQPPNHGLTILVFDHHTNHDPRNFLNSLPQTRGGDLPFLFYFRPRSLP